MTYLNKHSPKGLFAVVFGVIALCAAMVATPQAAQAVTAAQATIKNVVTVNYTDAGNNAMTAATATNFVIVDLVAAAPILSAPASQTTSAGSLVNYAYTITSRANGEDVITVSATSVDAGINAPTIDFYSDAALTTIITGGNVTLGASDVYSNVAIAAGTTTVSSIIVPADQTNDSLVNGIAADTYVEIGGVLFWVSAVTDNGGNNSVLTSTIDVYGQAAITNLTAGTLIYEQKTIYMAVAVGSLTGSADGTHTIDLAATDGVNSATPDQTITTVSGPNLQVAKYSANLTIAAVGGGTAITVDGIAFYPSGIFGKPTQTIGYLIIIKNTGSGDAKNVIVTDPIPAYTTYVAGSLTLDPYTGAGTTAAVTDGIGDDAGEVNVGLTEVTIYAGDGGTNVGGYAGGTGGTIPGGANNTSYARFSVTVD
ncbi:MAG: hypothetical protein R8L53_04760 [Mariprofundales bacterium]